MAGTAGRESRRSPVDWQGGEVEDSASIHDQDQAWVTYAEEEVRPYAITGGRTRPQHSMRLVTLLETADIAHARGLAPEAAQAVSLCQVQPCSVAEIAGQIGLPILVTKIILSDLIDCGALVMTLPVSGTTDHLQLLEALRSGLETRLSDVA